MKVCGADPADRSPYSSYLRAYIFADRFLAPKFRHAVNALLNSMHDSNAFWKLCGPADICLAFREIPASQVNLQRLVVSYAINWDPCSRDCSVQAREQLPVAFIRRVISTLSYKSRNKEKSEKELCYVEHFSKERKQSCNALHWRYDEKLELGFFEEANKSK